MIWHRRLAKLWHRWPCSGSIIACHQTAFPLFWTRVCNSAFIVSKSGRVHDFVVWPRTRPDLGIIVIPAHILLWPYFPTIFSFLLVRIPSNLARSSFRIHTLKRPNWSTFFDESYARTTPDMEIIISVAFSDNSRICWWELTWLGKIPSHTTKEKGHGNQSSSTKWINFV